MHKKRRVFGRYEAVCLPPAPSLLDGPVSCNLQLQLFLCDKIAPGFWAWHSHMMWPTTNDPGGELETNTTRSGGTDRPTCCPQLVHIPSPALLIVRHISPQSISKRRCWTGQRQGPMPSERNKECKFEVRSTHSTRGDSVTPTKVI